MHALHFVLTGSNRIRKFLSRQPLAIVGAILREKTTRTLVVSCVEKRCNCLRLVNHSRIEILPHRQRQVLFADPPGIFASRHRW